MIQAINLHKSYGSNPAVDDLSLEIRTGETLGLLGPNGAGKTTTINMLIGLLRPDSGSVAVGAEGESGDPVRADVRKKIGVAPQALSLYEDLTAKENLRFFGSLYDLSGGQLRDRVDWALRFSALLDRCQDRVSTFSGGMKRRLNIACALIHDPQVLLLDEPMVGVDPQSRNHIIGIMEGLRKQGMTIIYTTHYMEEAARLCDRVAIIDHGKLLDLDSVDGLIEKHGGRSVVTGTLVRNVESIEWPGRLEGLDLRFESTDPIEEIFRLKQAGAQFQTLNIARPDLESVFLSLTGRSLRDQ